MDRAASLADALREIRERHGHLAVSRGVVADLLTRRRPAADPLPPWWPGRMPAGHRLVELAGPSSCGKLSLAMSWLAVADQGGLVAVVDLAGTYYPPAAASAGLDLDRLVVVRPPSKRDAVDAVTLLATSAGFDAILWPLTFRTRPSGVAAQKLAQVAARSATRILALVDRPRGADWWGLATSDVRLAVTRHAWRWTDGELAGVDLDVTAERMRSVSCPDWTFRLDTGDGVRIAASGAKTSAGSRVGGGVGTVGTAV